MEIFNYILGLVQGAIGDAANGRIAFIVLITVSAFTFCLALMLLLSWFFRPEKGRLKDLGTAATVAKESKGADSVGRLLAAGGDKVGAKPGASRSRSRYQSMLIVAGYRNPGALSILYGIRLLAMFVLPIAAVFVTGVIFKLPTVPVWLFTAGAVMAGMVLPVLILERQMKKRQRSIGRGLPDALDLLVVCAEAGLGLKAALQRVAHDLYVSHPELGDELALVNAQTRVGIDNVDALRDLADRTGLPEMRSLTATLAQSIRFGTNLGDTLRIYSEELRDKRVQAAEESAAMVSTKMLFPLVLCIFPSFFVVALGPPFLGAMEALASTGRF